MTTKLKIFSFLLSFFILISSFGIFSSADNNKDFPKYDTAKAICVYNVNSEEIIYSKNMSKKIFPSGAVKMMTGLIACEMLLDRLDETVVITNEMLESASGATINLKTDMRVSVENLLYGTLCGGGNDASLVLAKLCKGDLNAFVNEMNSKATEWGLRSTHFTNPTGIDDENMYSTLEDIMIIARRAYSNELYMEISSKAAYSFTPIGADEKISFSNKNRLINSYDYKNPYAEGLSVGNTDLGGCSVITSAQRGDTKYICAVMGADEDSYYEIANSYIYHAIDNYYYVKAASANTHVCYAPLRLAMPDTSDRDARVSCVIMEDVYTLTDRKIDTENDIEYRYYLHKDMFDAPIRSGVIVGGVDIIYDDEIIARGKLVMAEDVEASEILLLLENMKKFFMSRVFIFSVLFFVILLFLFKCFSHTHYRRRRYKSSSKRI